jgi:2,3-bisphosphoglycerate-independent phosphoglycerate mutase
MAKGIPLGENDLVLRCNIISIDSEKQFIKDFTAGMISDSNAKKIISKIKLPSSRWEIYPGQSYRNILIIRDAMVNARSIICFPPHMHVNQLIRDIMPKSDIFSTQQLLDEISTFLIDTQNQIANMNLPKNCDGNMLWVWSPSHKPKWPSFFSRTNQKAALVGELDFLHGMAMAADIHFDLIPGATGYIDTDYQKMAEFAIKYLQEYDFVLIHVNAADEEAHQHNFVGKKEAIESIDRLIIAPLLTHLHNYYPSDFKIMVCGDHSTRCSDGKHTDALVPFAMYGQNVDINIGRQFSEKEALMYPPQKSLEILEHLLGDS